MAEMTLKRRWIPACAGMTMEKLSGFETVIPARAGIQCLLS